MNTNKIHVIDCEAFAGYKLLKICVDPHLKRSVADICDPALEHNYLIYFSAVLENKVINGAGRNKSAAVPRPRLSIPSAFRRTA